MQYFFINFVHVKMQTAILATSLCKTNDYIISLRCWQNIKIHRYKRVESLENSLPGIN